MKLIWKESLLFSKKLDISSPTMKITLFSSSNKIEVYSENNPNLLKNPLIL